MSKIYAIKLNNGNLHKNNLGEIVYFSNKNDVRAYMKYNHYDGIIQPLNIDIEKDKKIADLEAKLADMKRCAENNKKVAELVSAEHNAKIEKLEQQLAEKDEEIKNLVLARFESETNKPVITTTQIINQDKISFSVEQLEKVRKIIKTLHGQKNCKIGDSYIQKKDKLYNKYIIELDILEEVLGIFDNKIEELKREMK